MMIVKSEKFIFSRMVCFEFFLKSLWISSSCNMRRTTCVTWSIIRNCFRLWDLIFLIFNVLIIIYCSTVIAFVFYFFHFCQKSFRHGYMNKSIYTSIHFFKWFCMFKSFRKIIKNETICCYRFNSKKLLDYFLSS